MASPRGKFEKIVSRLVQVGFLIAVLLLWYLAARHWNVSRLLLPDPVNVWQELMKVLATGEFLNDLTITLTELAAAFVVSAISGITVGYFVSRSPYFVRVFEPLFAGVYSIPLILFLPLYVLLFGLGPASKIALGITISFFPVVLSAIAGFSNVEKILITAANSMGASNFQMLRYVLFPAALPVVLTGLRMGFTVALLSIIGSETIASIGGLGHRIVSLAESMDMARMFAYIVFVVAIAAILNSIVSTLEARGRQK